MTTSNNPQKPSENAVTAAPAKKDFNAFFAQKTADKMQKNEEVLGKFAAAKEVRANTPVTKEQAKAFFDKKRDEDAKRTPEQRKEAEKAFFARKADQFNKQREGYFEGLKGNERFAGVSDERLYKLAEMKVAYQRELSKDGIKPQVIEGGKKAIEFGKPVVMLDNAEFKAKMQVFDSHYANPKNLDKVLEDAKVKFEASKTAENTTANTREAGETQER